MSFLNGIRHNLRHGIQPQQNKDLDAPAPSGEQDGARVPAGADVDAVAGAIEQAGLSVPATLALEVGKPLSWLGGQLLWVFQPFADVLGIRARKGPLSVEGVARMLEREGSTDALLERLDAGVKSRERGGRR
ncbi:MAG: hypothetical protein M3437_00240 [Chloroflexota bacterium]|nr:hypothetical protein [Chloroflexota bacterium]MDQ5864241.1 hypothetical protein [Chloroflexota bacterium]